MNQINTRENRVMEEYMVTTALEPKLICQFDNHHMIISVLLDNNNTAYTYEELNAKYINLSAPDIFQLSIIEKKSDTTNYMKLYEIQKIIYQLIIKCSFLEKLILSGLRSVRLNFIRDCLVNNKLIHLDISNCYFNGDQDAIMIQEILTNSISLKYFRLFSSNVQDDMLVGCLLSGIQNNQTLTHLDLSGTKGSVEYI
jgi:hypothetical protein